MSGFEVYLFEACCYYLAENSENLITKIRGKNIEDLHNIKVSDIELEYRISSSSDEIKTALIRALLKAYKDKKISTSDLSEVLGLNIHTLGSSKFQMSKFGFSIGELLGAAINDKLYVPRRIVQGAGAIGLLKFVHEGINESSFITADELVKINNQLNLWLCLFGYGLGVNVGSGLYLVEECVSTWLIEIEKHSGLSFMNRSDATLVLLSTFINAICASAEELNYKDNVSSSELSELIGNSDKRKLDLLINALEGNSFEQAFDNLRQLRDIVANKGKADCLNLSSFFEDLLGDGSEEDLLRTEICVLNKQKCELELEVSSLKNKLGDYKQHISDINSENSKLKNEISRLGYFTKFGSDSSNECIEDVSDPDINIEKVRAVKEYLSCSSVCCIGGHQRLLNILSKEFPEISLIGRDDSLQNNMITSKDVIIINAHENEHGHSYKVRSKHRKDQKVFMILARSYNKFIDEVYDYVRHL